MVTMLETGSESDLTNVETRLPSAKTTSTPKTTEVYITNINNYYSYEQDITEPKDLSSDFKVVTKKNVFIFEAGVVKTLRSTLNSMTDSLDEPLSFEQDIAVIANCLKSLEKRKSRREIYYTDILTILSNIFLNFKCNEITEPEIKCIDEVVQAVSKELTQKDISYYRSKLRDAKIEFLPPFPKNFDFEKNLREIFE